MMGKARRGAARGGGGGAECRVGELVRPQGVRKEVDGGREELGFGTRGNVFIL